MADSRWQNAAIFRQYMAAHYLHFVGGGATADYIYCCCCLIAITLLVKLTPGTAAMVFYVFSLHIRQAYSSPLMSVFSRRAKPIFNVLSRMRIIHAAPYWPVHHTVRHDCAY